MSTKRPPERVKSHRTAARGRMSPGTPAGSPGRLNAGADAEGSMKTLVRPPMQLSPVQSRFRAALLEKLATGEYEYERAETCLCGGTASVQPEQTSVATRLHRKVPCIELPPCATKSISR